jgi:hypothetical protein
MHENITIEQKDIDAGTMATQGRVWSTVGNVAVSIKGRVEATSRRDTRNVEPNAKNFQIMRTRGRLLAILVHLDRASLWTKNW